MKRISHFFFFLFTAIPALSFSAQVKVSIYADQTVKAFSLVPVNGNYFLFCDTLPPKKIAVNSELDFSLTGDSVKISKKDSLIGKFKTVRIAETVHDTLKNGNIRIRCIQPYKSPRIYPDGFEISAKAGGGLLILNTAEMEHYVAGVVQAEVGKSNPMEFDKVKAIIIRTYSLSNMGRHAMEGFNLCDQVHCQAYFGKSNTKNIIDAVDGTKGEVLVDTSLSLVNASFFSNCGGQTCNSEDVWTKALPYLRSVKDTFCLSQPDAFWEKKIKKEDWLSYFAKKYKLNTADTAVSAKLLSFTQDSRTVYLLEDPVKIPFTVLRSDWKLRSAFFNISCTGDIVDLKGRGFGHGVGLCQEGAMKMSKLGYSSTQIINYYYKDVNLIDLNRLEFFRDN